MVTLVNTSYNINRSRDQLFISQNQVGASGLSTPIAIKPNFVLLPDYDPSALQSLLLETVAHPAEKDLYLVLVPGKNPGEDAVPALWLTNQPDPHGTLDGKPVTLHHFILRLYKSQYDLVADETNTLMMASSTNLSAIYTRDGSISWCTANNVGSDANNSSRLCFTFVRVATPIVPSTPLPTKFAAAEKHTFAVPPQARVLAIQPMIRDSNRQLPIMI